MKKLITAVLLALFSFAIMLPMDVEAKKTGSFVAELKATVPSVDDQVKHVGETDFKSGSLPSFVNSIIVYKAGYAQLNFSDPGGGLPPGSTLYYCIDGILYENGVSTGKAGKAVCGADGTEHWLVCDGNTMIGHKRETQRYCLEN